MKLNVFSKPIIEAAIYELLYSYKDLANEGIESKRRPVRIFDEAHEGLLSE